MEEFNTIEKIRKLFKDVNCEGKENCYFIAYKDMTRNSGMVNGMEYPYDALLINRTENGLGVFYLQQDGIPWKYNISKMHVDKNSYFFIKNEDIKIIATYTLIRMDIMVFSMLLIILKILKRYFMEFKSFISLVFFDDIDDLDEIEDISIGEKFYNLISRGSKVFT